ncbi:MAG: hypothetical protein A2X66_00465 [Ignavibacteria bacterium GWA2_54_16]|nr:MAG: hypothetical protein A2X66_00465 [Ignavibacteria bacterium GWA2_54_16]
MEYAKGEGVNWRREMELWIDANLKHAVFNPNRESEQFLARRLPGMQFRDLKQRNLEQYTTLVRDLIDTDVHEIAERSDYVICYWDSSAQRGAGTTGEVTTARFARKPVYLVTELDLQEIPGWILGCATKVFSSFDELRTFLLRTYKEGSED